MLEWVIAAVLISQRPLLLLQRSHRRAKSSATGQPPPTTRLHTSTLKELVRTIRGGRVVGGGCPVALDFAPWWGRGLLNVWNLISRTLKLAAGSFLFCRADVFHEVGAFSEDLYAAEDIGLSQRLKCWAKSHRMNFVILKTHPHMSSGRKFEQYSSREIFLLACHMLYSPFQTCYSKARLHYLYDGRR